MIVFTPNRVYIFRRGSLPIAVAAWAYTSRAAIWLNSGAAATNFMNDRRLEFSMCITGSPLMFRYKAGSEDGKTHSSIFVLRQRNPRSHRQNMRLGSRFVLVVETHSAIWTKVISVSCFRRVAALDPVHSASRYHFTLSIYYQINFFRLFMMVRK